MSNISLSRPITSYTKVRTLIGNIKRNKTWQLKPSLNNKKYLDVGCGHNAHPNFVNLDYEWLPNVDVCWNLVTNSLPFPDNRFEGIYTEHCLEHIPFEACEKNIKEFYRVLKPGGTLRIIVPDGEIYVDIYNRQKQGEKILMPYQESYISGMHRINGIFRNHGHLFIYDFETFRVLLERNGFKNIKKMSFGKGRNPDLLNDTPDREIESLYVEAEK